LPFHVQFSLFYFIHFCHWLLPQIDTQHVLSKGPPFLFSFLLTTIIQHKNLKDLSTNYGSNKNTYAFIFQPKKKQKQKKNNNKNNKKKATNLVLLLKSCQQLLNVVQLFSCWVVVRSVGYDLIQQQQQQPIPTLFNYVHVCECIYVSMRCFYQLKICWRFFADELLPTYTHPLIHTLIHSFTHS